ncbi:MAG: 16S rRNA processing protein RimM [Deltaproteobacteria bacterium]|nr:16S rRNA processing protein RimM [Deltaproteobacteria bacterium]
MSPPPLLAVGYVARAHGVRGRILVTPFNAESQGLERVQVLWLARDGQAPKQHKVSRGERVHLGYIYALQGLDDRDVAESLKGSEVSVARAELPALDEDQLYAADLIGLTVIDTTGVERGVIEAFEQAGPNELLSVRGPKGVSLVPLAFLVEVDAQNRALIDAPEGLFDLDTTP